MNNIPSKIAPLVWRLVFAAALLVVFLSSRSHGTECATCLASAAPYRPQADSWIFSPSRYSHDPATGARVAQYDQIAPVEPLPDQREVTSGYSRTRSVLRGADGSTSASYVVTNFGNGRGGMDAEWERFHDAWRGSTVGGGNFGVVSQPYGGFVGPYGSGYGQGHPGYGGWYPGFGRSPGQGYTSPNYGYGSAGPDPRLLDPDAADGYRDGVRPRESNREFFRPIPKAGFQRAPRDDSPHNDPPRGSRS